MDLLSTLTVGRVSGLIALGNAVVSITAPLLIGIILIRHHNKTLSAATWTVIARQFHSSLWPTILQADSAAIKNVSWGVATIAYVGTALAVLISVSSIITPLGLGDEIRPTAERNVSLQYVPDFSLYGTSTQSRPNMPLSRDCIIGAVSCPGAHVPGSVIDQGNLNVTFNTNITATTAIPENITTMFRSATDGSTLASILDIQYRSWLPSSSVSVNNGEPYPRGKYDQMEILIPRDGVVLVEGIMADMKKGGVGFRNHTGPVGSEFGAVWAEDILWVEPDVSCSNTNLSLEFTLGDYSTVSDPLLAFGVRDQGGFSGLRHGNPYSGWPNLNFSAPDVRGRADRTAWLNNYLASLVLNLTDEGGTALSPAFGINVTEGGLYPIELKDLDALNYVPFGMNTASIRGSWLHFDDVLFDYDGNLVVLGGNTIAEKDARPHLFAAALFTEADGRCSGRYTNQTVYADSNVACGYMFGTPTKVSEGDRRLLDRGSEWRSSMFVCAGAVQASVKTITFYINGSTSLDSVAVQSITDKHYESPSEYPLWAMEDWWHPGSEGAAAAPLWGIVDNSHEGTPGYNFTRAPSLYLPSTFDVLTWDNIDGPLDMLAGAVAPFGILAQVLSKAFEDSGIQSHTSYRGSDNLVLREKWNSLSNDPRGAEQIVRLVWTDMMASATVGTNSRVPPPGTAGTSSSDDAPTTRATIYARRITYDLRYAVPAAVVLVAWVALLLGGLLAGIVHRRLFAHLKEMVNDTSVGRVAAAAADPRARRLLRAPTRKWVEGAGYVQVQLGDGWEVEEEHLQDLPGPGPSEADKHAREFHHSLLPPSPEP